MAAPTTPVLATDDAVRILRELIRIDSTNDGTIDTRGEAEAAEYVESLLTDVGVACERFSTTSGRRQGVYARIAGKDSSRPPLLLHGHLDVVPAQASDWRVDPFAAEVEDDMVWGRGAVDMKDTDAMILALVRKWAQTGERPSRDLVVLMLPDEEAGGHHGSHWIVDHRPDMLEGVQEAVGEVGGFSLTIAENRRLYLIQTAEKGIAWMRLVAEGTAGHGSMINRDNAVTEVAEALARLGRHEWPVCLSPTAEHMVRAIGEAYGIDIDLSDFDSLQAQLGPLARLIGAGTRHVTNPTMLDAGYKANVIPGHASATVDGRFVPGAEEAFFEEVDRILGPRVRREFVTHDVAIEAPYDVPLVAAMTEALIMEDPTATVAPYLLSAGTDAKAFSRLGIHGYGFSPLQLPPDLDFAALFHGVDERVPIESVQFGVRVLEGFLDRA